LGSMITIILIRFSYAARSIGLLCARKGGQQESCRAHLTSLFCNFKWSLGSLITIILIRFSYAARSIGLLCARKGGQTGELPCSPNISFVF